MFTPYPFQQQAINAAITALNNKMFRVLVVAPTGSGKSVMIACCCQQVNVRWKLRVLVLSSFTEILLQDHAALKKQLPHIGIGLYSAECGSKTIDRVTVAGIQSVWRKPQLFRDFDLIMVDEAHLVSFDKNTMFRQFLDALNKPTIGWTATHFRMKGGYLHKGQNAYFRGVAYEISIPVLQKEGKLCEVITQGSKIRLDASKIRIQAGDYVTKELSSAFDRDSITRSIVQDLVQHKESRKKWLGFAIDIAHAEHLAAEGNRQDVESYALHSKLDKHLRRKIIAAYRAGEFQHLVSVDMITTGLDVRDIDLLYMARHTRSAARVIQMIGRGMRVFPGKENLLCLDYARNIKENGPIDNPKIPEPKQRKRKGDPLVRECPECFLFVNPSVRICPRCEFVFPIKHKLSALADMIEIVSKGIWHEVDGVNYSVKTSRKNGLPMLIVKYSCKLRVFVEYVLFNHTGYPRAKAERWWELMTGGYGTGTVPHDSQEALQQKGLLRRPIEIFVKEKGKYPQITDYLFKEK